MTTSSVVRLRRSSKPLPKAKRAPKNCHGHCLVVCCLSDLLQLSESQQNHYIWKVCSANQWDALKMATSAASIGQRNGPSSYPWQCLIAWLHNQCFKSWMNWTRKFCLICHIHLTSRQLITLTTFAGKKLQASWHLFVGKMLPQPTRGRKYFPRLHQIPKRRFLHCKNIQTYFSWTKMCWL